MLKSDEPALEPTVAHGPPPGAHGADTTLFDLSNDELDRYPAGVITLSRDATILSYNRAESAVSRLKPHEVIGRNFFRDVAPCTAVQDFQGRFESFAAGVSTGAERFDWCFMFKWGRQDVSITLLRRAKRPEIHLVVTVRSLAAPIPIDAIDFVTPSVGKLPSHPQIESEVGIWANDPATNTSYRSEELHRILAAGAELETHVEPIVRYAHPNHVDALESAIKHASDRGRSYLLRTTIVTADGSEKDVLVHGAYLDARSEKGSRSIGSVVDLTKRRAVEDQLWASAHLDPLTHLPNRRYLLESLKAAIDVPNAQIGVAFIDLDKFKSVNDSAGHAAGDLLLRYVALRISRAIRPGDIVSRINGDEFVIIFGDVSPTTQIEPLLGRVLDSVSEPYLVEGKRHVVSACAGIATYPADGTTAEELLVAADMAMYRAKARGAGSFVRFTRAMLEIAAKDRERAAELTFAIDRGEIVPYFQAIVDAGTHRIVGVEALARWKHPTLGVLLPAEFIDLAEESGAIFALGIHILREACTWGRRWYDALGDASPFISVNVSPLQFRDRRFSTTIRDILAETGIPPEKLELEFTESLVMDRFDETMLALADLKLLGVRLSIDDFGTGYSALAYLKYFPIDTVKLDRAFVGGLGIDSIDDSIVETIVTLASRLHLSVIAEGVETALQARRLLELHSTFLQGFHFSLPAPPEDFEPGLLSGRIARLPLA